jgi:N-ethylmaleimide reductase
LVERFENNLELAAWDQDTLPGAKGYTDYETASK